MDQTEREWLAFAISEAEAAKRKGVTVLFIRKQDEADLIVTNAETPAMVAAMNGDYEEE